MAHFSEIISIFDLQRNAQDNVLVLFRSHTCGLRVTEALYLSSFNAFILEQASLYNIYSPHTG